MNRFWLLLFLFLPALATADEIQLDHTFGTAPLSTQALAFSPDTKRLAVAGSDGVKIYEAATGKLLETRAGTQLLTSCVAWSRDGKSLAVGGAMIGTQPRGEIVLWHPDGVSQRWTTDHAVVKSLDFSPDDQFLASASGGDLGGEREAGAIRVWNAHSGKLIRTLGTYYGFGARVSFGPKNRVAFGYEGFDTTERRLLDWPSGRLLQKDDIGDVPLVWTPAGQLAKSDSDTLAFQEKEGIVRRVVLLKGDSTLKAVFVAQNVKGQKALARVELGPCGLNAALQDDLLAISSPQGVKLWRIAPNSRSLRPLYTLNRTLAPDQLALSGDKSTLAITTNRGVLLLGADLKSQRLLPELRPVEPLAFSHDGKQLWANQWLDIAGKAPRRLGTPAGIEFAPFGVSVPSPQGDSLVEGYTLRFPSGKQVPLLVPDAEEDDPDRRRPLGRTLHVNWRPDGQEFVATSGSLGGSSSDDGFFVFDKTGRFKRELLREDGLLRLRPRDAAFSPDGTLIATTGLREVYDPTERTNRSWTEARIDLWDAKTGTFKKTFSLSRPDFQVAGGDQSRHLQWSPDGQTLAVSGEFIHNNQWQERVRFLDAATGENWYPYPYNLPSMAKIQLGRF